MLLSVLPVRVGDSFLVRNGSFTALIDGGINKTDIIRLLDAKRLHKKHISVVVCTHYDADHINGILGVIRSKYTFDEIWLPEIYGSLANSILRNITELIQYYDNRTRLENYSSLSQPPEYEIEEVTPDQPDDSFERIDSNLLDYYMLFLKHFWPWSPLYRAPNRGKMAANLQKICMLVSQSLQSGSYIRWFKYEPTRVAHKVHSGFNAENSRQTSITVYTPQVFDQILHLTTINKQSLVFRYAPLNLPNILFTADSDLSFLHATPIQLERYSVVTAPHHGSDENKAAYQRIKGEGLIFVRSDRSQKKRPGIGYLAQKQRYCTICKTKGPHKEIIVNFRRKKTPSVAGTNCQCENEHVA
jgi:Metallo-beta-lactamase superfamily